MPGQVCRIRWRKGLPLSLSVSPRKCFLGLPQELRDKICYYSLISSEPITVWSGTYDVEECENCPGNGNLTRTSWETMDTNVADSGDLALGLLLCNQQLSRDAAAIFYRWNTFRFMGDHNWSPLYTFLVMIGPENRRNLRSLEMQMSKPKQVLQHPDGTRTSLDYWPFCEVVPFNTQLRSYSTPSVEGLVDHLDPAIEACFRILGKNRPALTLMLRLDRHHLPGMHLLTDHHFPDLYYFNLDLPVMIEKFRQDFTANSNGTSQVEVLWKGECKRDQFADLAGPIQDRGWLIVEKEESYFNQDSTDDHEFFMGFALRRKELSVASFPAGIKTS